MLLSPGKKAVDVGAQLEMASVDPEQDAINVNKKDRARMEIRELLLLLNFA
jgi:hypothetical protein